MIETGRAIDREQSADEARAVAEQIAGSWEALEETLADHLEASLVELVDRARRASAATEAMLAAEARAGRERTRAMFVEQAVLAVRRELLQSRIRCDDFERKLEAAQSRVDELQRPVRIVVGWAAHDPSASGVVSLRCLSCATELELEPGQRVPSACPSCALATFESTPVDVADRARRRSSAGGNVSQPPVRSVERKFHVVKGG